MVGAVLLSRSHPQTGVGPRYAPICRSIILNGYTYKWILYNEFNLYFILLPYTFKAVVIVSILTLGVLSNLVHWERFLIFWILVKESGFSFSSSL